MQPIARVLRHLAFTVHRLQDHLFEMPAVALAQAVGGDLDGSLTHPEFRAITLFSSLCQSLAEAHRLGIVHRDLKPANLLLESDEALKVADFGLAKVLDRPDYAFTLTNDQAALGTPYYMAPEQREGSADVDQRTDISSLGVVFYEMLTGELPTGHFKPPSQLAVGAFGGSASGIPGSGSVVTFSRNRDHGLWDDPKTITSPDPPWDTPHLVNKSSEMEVVFSPSSLRRDLRRMAILAASPMSSTWPPTPDSCACARVPRKGGWAGLSSPGTPS
ncbi:MAG: serine/threonine-protein kinase [Roseibacillus sp.]